jgi:glycerophosphoryl diester phosphodiesterase
MALTITTPLIIGHRGAAAHAPENTCASIREAARQGARMVEFDATITGDNPPAVILFHDDTLERTTNGSGAVDRMPLNDLKQLDAGDGERIPTLKQAIDDIHRLGLMANVEIKVAPNRDLDTAEAVMTDLITHWSVNTAPPYISSFSIKALEIAMTRRPDWPRGLLIRDMPDDWRQIAERLNVSTINISATRTSRADLALLVGSGWPIMVYTVNDPQRAVELLNQGVSALFTDSPQTLLPLLDNRPTQTITLPAH